MGCGGSTNSLLSAEIRHREKKTRVVPRKLNASFVSQVIRDVMLEIHQLYLNPTGEIFVALSDVIHGNSYELEILITGTGSASEEKKVLSLLQYCVENLIYNVSDIMPNKGPLGTYYNSGIYELIREGNQFPDGYFLQVEIDRLQFQDNLRTINVEDAEAFLLLLGAYITRGFVTTMLLKPVEYRLLSVERYTGLAATNLKVLATVLLYIVRRLSITKGKGVMPIPGELRRHIYTDEEMKIVYAKIAKSISYSEDLLRSWGTEYIRRLRIAAQYEEEDLR